ncbi:protein SRG1-like [Ipomoea triloba]|uniref:protein SRG1-like n=1 Tax=Ipomoea triloba TaxID=35885 RepID=UPI00125D5FFC|nr:protein SRG1-like [Ipomoea triloba]
MESDPQTQFGATLPVPSVQELAKQKPAAVPSRYIRQDLRSPPESKPPCSSTQVPVIDMQKLMSQESTHDSELRRLHFACKDWGFFQLINHGVSSSVLEKAKVEVQGFFNLPLEEKQKCGQIAGEIEGFGQLFVVSEEQKLDWADMFFIKTLPQHIRSPHLFPKLPPSFRDTIEAYSVEVNKVAMKVLRLIAKNLGIKDEEMCKLYEGGMQSMRMNYYPPCPQPELVMGLSPHSDADGLTILLQVNETQGLQIKKNGAWLPVVPIPNSLIVNIGDTLEIFTNGIYRSIEHRAVVSWDKERMSVATFHAPKLDAELGPAGGLVTAETPPKYKRISVPEFFRLFFSSKLDGKSHVDVFKIANNNA